MRLRRDRAAHIARIGLVVPAHDEVDLLSDCLTALRKATVNVDVPVRTVVVLDGCTDGSEEACREFAVDTVTLEAGALDAGNVGRARAAGVRAVLAGEAHPESVWLANTDADSRVPVTWLQEQLELARDGADAVLGVVRLDEDGRSGRGAHATQYAQLIGRDGSHHHVHGANLGVRASAYLQAGGFPPLSDHEDRELVRRLRALVDVTVISSARLQVVTSGRLVGRCRQGFSADLARLSRGEDELSVA
jgi:GT2 family glycosyltransferase